MGRILKPGAALEYEGNLKRMDTMALSEHSNAAAGLLSAMANPKRLMILCCLVKGEVAVGALASQVGLSQSALSQHLSKLRAQKLVKTRRDAQTIYYSSSSESVLKVLETLEEIYCAPVQKKSAAA
ncbi:Transcriptional regulator protein (Repressor of nodulation genes), ArsR family [Neorhizobium galegae bv. orientalis]|jgi:DNA-binding transcriptional ArsR family regulator|uniref:Nodulation protein NolR n=3 Tax=Neorhizobium galegae TaxID=399 RepID=A0A068SR32_NEOGA|nr:Nodulation protein NolR [Neorhizobium galegae bv. orientalis str. HAMBI 540]CDN54927.1 Nodulation protein NolR [Neorhizobium galegae bv. officinalis bv. officinalis str. HAMBI 1141]CDZ52434.1 Transcriptional regulator protein (Repressor of nodulation genes), ArsR family [Neorhizobium galegae bv. orientalis]